MGNGRSGGGTIVADQDEAPAAPNDCLAVLLATHNGATYLDRQLQSIAEQDWPRIDVWASDDASTDFNWALLQDWQGRWRKGQFRIVEGAGAGFAENFRRLITMDEVDADHVAFSDQDDIWLPDKTRAAVASIDDVAGPALYCERTVLVDGDGREIGRSPLFRRPAHFRNAMVQNIAGGNTMVMNRSAFSLLREAATRTGFVSHDWFAYLLISGAGGTVRYCAQSHVHYRQHAGNLVGSNMGWAARLRRIRQGLRGRYGDWNERNLGALGACRSLLGEEAIATIELFGAARSGPLLRRLAMLRKSGVYRQTLAGQLSLYAACVLEKL